MIASAEGPTWLLRKLLIILTVILLFATNAAAFKVTIDSTKVAGGTNYQTLDALLSGIQAKNPALSTSGEDTVIFTDTTQRVYTMSAYMDADSGSIRFIGASTDPNRFPIINHTSSDYYSFFNKVNVTFDRLVLTGKITLMRGSTSKSQIFRRCIIRDYSDSAKSFLNITGAGTSKSIFENCLIVNNKCTKGIVEIGSDPSPVIQFISCTFDGNSLVLSSPTGGRIDSVSFKNCIFSGNTAIFNGAPGLNARVTYSVVPGTTYTGTGNIVATDLKYSVIAGKLKPYDWRPTDSSAARGIGDTLNTPRFDISGKLRVDATGKRDAGCLDILDGVTITGQPKSDTVLVGEAVVFKVVATGAPDLLYAWYKKGGAATALAATDSLKLSSVSLADDSSFYYCVITNPSSSVTSDTVRLRVFQKPVITDQPDSMIGYVGDTVAFSVAATGGGLSYAWQRNGTAVTGATTAILKVPSVTVADSGALFVCTITNAQGSAVSQSALLQVLPSRVKITAFSRDTVLDEGATLSLSVTATGKAPLVFSWRKLGSTVEISAAASYVKTNASFGDSGSYRCVVSNASSKDSVTVKVGVIAGASPRITSQPKPFVVVKAGAPVSLAVTATGAAPLSFTWYKKTGAADATVGSAATLSISAASAGDSGMYYCVVKNTLGADTSEIITITISSSAFFNPLLLECSFVDRAHIRARVQNFRELSADAGTPPFTDTIGIWYKNVTIPAGTLTRSDPNLIKVPLSKMTAVSGDVFDTVLAVTGTGNDCSIMHFVVTPLWKQPDTIVSVVASAQHSTVYMCDTATLENKLVLMVDYTAVTDSIVVRLSNLTSLKRDTLKSLSIAYSLNNTAVMADTILAAALPAANVDLFRKVYRNVRFTAAEETLSVTVKWQGILGNSSVPVSKNLLVGKPRPANTARLVVDSSNSSAAFLRWQFTGVSDFDSIRIVWGIPPISPSTDVSGASYKTLSVQSAVRSVVIENLLPSRLYYFGIQVVKNSVVSVLTSEAIASCSTKVATGDVENSIAVLSALFLPQTNQFKLVWTIDTLLSGSAQNLETGIVVSAVVPPDIREKVELKDYVTFDNCKDTNTLTMDAPQGLLFSTPYHFALILRRKTGTSWASATDASRAVVTTSKPVWQIVTYFKGTDTSVTAFNGNVILNKTVDGVLSVTDTLRVFSPDNTLNGFVAASRLGFDFVRDAKSDPIRISMLYDATLFGALPAARIRMYQYDAKKTAWKRVEKCNIDTVTRVVSAVLRPSDNPLPFMLLIDTLPPVVSLTSDTISPVVPGVPVVDTIIVTDNTFNCEVSVVYWGIQGNGGVVSSVHRCSTSVCTLYTTMPADSIVRDRSLKAELVISDGISKKVCDISRVVKKEVSDPVMLAEMQWTPVMTSTLLDNRGVEFTFKELSPNETWLYDPLQFRVFRWVNSGSADILPGMTSTSAQWVELSGTNRLLFTMDPGKVIWVKSRKNRELKSLGSGTTVPVKQSFDIVLKAQEWTDVALPFKFDIRLSDIFNESKGTPDAINKILVCNWATDEVTKNIVATPKYIPNVPDYNLGSTALTYKTETGGFASYTLFNDDIQDITLKIPPVPEMASTLQTPVAGAVAKSAKSKQGWSITLKAATKEGTLSPVLLGSMQGSGKKQYPLPPSLQKARVCLTENGSKKPSGILLDEYSEGAFVFAVFENDENNEVRFEYTFLDNSNLPEGWNAIVHIPETGTIVPMYSPQVLTVPALSKKYAVIIVGDSAFIAAGISSVSPQFKLYSLYPNPCRGEMTLRFTLPLADIERVHVSLFDQLGRSVREQRLQGAQLRTGYNSLRWNMREKQHLSAGTYILKFEAFTNAGRSFGRKQQRILYLP